jgi:hypothetical protein
MYDQQKMMKTKCYEINLPKAKRKRAAATDGEEKVKETNMKLGFLNIWTLYMWTKIMKIILITNSVRVRSPMGPKYPTGPDRMNL